MTENQTLGKLLHDAHSSFKEAALGWRRFKHKDILPLIKNLSSDHIHTIELGKSIEDRAIYEIKLGKGKKNVMLWSQMHGDEPTSTMVIFDILNFLQATDLDFDEIRNTILNNLELSFIPMLNPDGVQKFQRRNAVEIDLNRDALAMSCPESRILKAAHNKNKPIFGFNLHDQSKYYNVPFTKNTATHSFLAPAYNYAKDINDTRKAAMQGIALMHEVLEHLLPEHTGRYNDDFEPRAFGDNIQSWGTSTILVEAGGLRGDPEKQEIRRLHFSILLSLLYNIALDKVSDYSVEQYWAIPENDRKLNDLIIRDVQYPKLDKVVDISININEVDDDTFSSFHHEGQIEDLGDLSTFFGYSEHDAVGLSYLETKVFPEVLEDIAAINRINPMDLLKKGFGVLRVKNFQPNKDFERIPLLLLDASEEVKTKLKQGNKCAFFLEDTKGIRFAVINGKMTEL